MSTILLPFDIITYIIDTVGENGDTNLLKELALVSRCFHELCCKYLFATVDLSVIGSGSPWNPQVPSPKKRFVRLLESRPDVVKYIRQLKYEVGLVRDTSNLSLQCQAAAAHRMSDDYLLSPILPNLLRTITCLNCLTIDASHIKWNEINPYLTSAFLHLMHLPTINNINLSTIPNFPVSSLILPANLLRLDLTHLSCVEPFEDEIAVVQSEMMPKLREFHTSYSPGPTTLLLRAKRQDGQPAFNITNLRRLSSCLGDKQNLRYLLQNAKLLERLHLTVGVNQSLEGLLSESSSARTLKVLGFSVLILFSSYFPQPLEGVFEELEALAGNNVLEAISFEIDVYGNEAEDAIGSLIQNVKKLVATPGWPALRQVSFEVRICVVAVGAELSEALQSLFDRYSSHSSKLESVAFNFSAYVV